MHLPGLADELDNVRPGDTQADLYQNHQEHPQYRKGDPGVTREAMGPPGRRIARSKRRHGRFLRHISKLAG